MPRLDDACAYACLATLAAACALGLRAMWLSQVLGRADDGYALSMACIGLCLSSILFVLASGSISLRLEGKDDEDAAETSGDV